MKKSYIYAAAAIAMWSTMATISKVLLGEMDSYKVLCVSTFFATVAMLIINLCSKKWNIMKGYCLKDYLKMAAIGLPGVFLYYAFYYAGAAKMPASQAFIVNYLWPIMSIVFACVVLKEKITLRKIIAVIMSFLGVFTVAGDDLIHFNGETVTGMLCCFGAAVCYGLYTAINKKSTYDKQVSMTVAMFAAFLPSLVVMLIRGENLWIQPMQLPGILWNGVVTMALANLAWALALSAGNTAKVSNLAYITPFLSLVWTFLILKEPIKPLSILGLCMIVAGIFIQLKKSRGGKRTPEHPDAR
jgi:drug/metabolite transporter (DMT)-like permease